MIPPRRRERFNPSWGPAGTVGDRRTTRRLRRFNPSWGPAGTTQGRSYAGLGRSCFNPSWGPAGTAGGTVRGYCNDELQPLVGSCWNPPFSVCAVNVEALQPLVGSCWNRLAGAVPHADVGASTPRGVLLEHGAAGSEAHDPLDIVAAAASTPRGVLLEPAPLRDGHRARSGFNPSWGPAGTHSWTTRSLDVSTLQPLVGSCWNAVAGCPPCRCPPSFNPSWGPAGTLASVAASGVSNRLQPLVGSCWNLVEDHRPVLRPLASTPRGVLLEPSISARMT